MPRRAVTAAVKAGAPLNTHTFVSTWGQSAWQAGCSGGVPEDPVLVVQLPGSREARSGPAHGGEHYGRSPRAASPRISASPVAHSQHTGLTPDATVCNWTHMAMHRHSFHSATSTGRETIWPCRGLDLASRGLPPRPPC